MLNGQTGRAEVPDPEPPDPSELRARLRLLAIPEADLADVTATLPDPVHTPELWRALLHCHRALFSDEPVDWPSAPAELGAQGRYFYVHLYLMALPAALARQARHGVPDDVVHATLADLGAKSVAHRRAFGVGGFDKQSWIVHHFRGTLHRIGRLQFERSVLDAAACGGLPPTGGPAAGQPVLNVHIPGDGPMSPALCDESFAAAPAFFARHFPGTRYPFATCHSWLLDEQLADDLPATSNIVRFQQRFRPFGARPVCDDDVLEFVFHVRRDTARPTRLPRDSTLQRAVLDRIASGGHWHLGHGWTALPAARSAAR
ncbi:acyltransferase domain-containing protein [Streptomyces sp. XM4193]|uniref:acyltransferase domain-containing protein n=1 Tax=Streptomyces sp. XM4193 TaxID=2929782 RepID=UPI001FF80D49|nr:acyltransferase domain-containing protein [Streptomyces sp. XM4193]MCK1798089.1 acyltransferase domain-containing protein [Streptomyces sp. XM4193]